LSIFGESWHQDDVGQWQRQRCERSRMPVLVWKLAVQVPSTKEINSGGLSALLLDMLEILWLDILYMIGKLWAAKYLAQ
jgi:hypothetical protein